MNLQKNLFGGMTAAIIALPLGLAFGVASGLGPTAGIYGAIILGFSLRFLEEQLLKFLDQQVL